MSAKESGPHTDQFQIKDVKKSNRTGAGMPDLQSTIQPAIQLSAVGFCSAGQWDAWHRLNHQKGLMPWGEVFWRSVA
jgi:hypothetical protein